MRRIPAALTLVLLVVVLAANVRRARKQSVTVDEARTYLNYVDAPWRAVFVDYDANNHVLNTLAERLTASVFGVSEFTLRLPSLAGGALYLAAVFLLCRRLFGAGPLLLLSVATLTLNPYVLDFLSAARGYGMALAFFLWALEFVLRYFEQADPKQLWRASAALGLAAAANLTLVFPGVVLAGAVAVVLAARREWRVLADQFMLPGLVVAFVVLAIPLSRATGCNFYVGAPGLGETLESLVLSSLEYGGAPVLPWLRGFSLRLAPAALGGCVLLGAWLVWRRRRAFAPEERFFLLCVGPLAGSVALTAALHKLWSLPYPVYRTGLYLIALSCLTGFALLRLAARRRATALTVLPAGIVFFSLCVVQFALRWNSRFYLDWFYDARTRDLVGMIERRHTAGGGATVAVTWPLGQTVEFYQRVRRLDWLQVKHRQLDPGPADYYILTFDDPAPAGKLEVLLRDEFSGVILLRAR